MPPPFTRWRVAGRSAPPARRPPRRPPATKPPPHWRATPLHALARRQGHRPTGASPAAPTAGDEGAAPRACRPPPHAGASPGAPLYRHFAHRAVRRRPGRRPTGVPPPFHALARRREIRLTGASPTAPTTGDEAAAPLACYPPSRAGASPGAPPHRRVAHRTDRRRRGCRPTGVPPLFTRRRVARGAASPARRPPRRPPATRAPPHWRAAPLHSPARRQGRRLTGKSPTALTAGDQSAAPRARHPPFTRWRVASGTAPPGRRPPRRPPAIRAPPHGRAAPLRLPLRCQGRRPTGASPTAPTAGDQGAAPLA